MTKLTKMLFREIRKSKGQFIAAAVVVMAGISMFAAMYMSYLNLKNSVEYYYDQYKFLDYYAQVNACSNQTINQIKQIKGVKQAMGRMSKDVGTDIRSDKKVTLRLVSLPDEHMPEINQIYVMQGGYFRKSLSNSCLLDNKFADSYKLKVGDNINAIINLKKYVLHIDGIVASPEFIYAMKSSNSISMSSEEFGIIYIKETTARSILGFNQTFNQVHVLFEKGVNQEPVVDKIEATLKSNGLISSIERKDQLSEAIVSNELKQLKSQAYAFPVVFLSVAAAIIYMMQRRIINSQRNLVGVMKALGYTDRRILFHYVLYSIIIALAGAIPAIFLGLWMGAGMTSLYKQVFSLPVMQIKIYMDVFIIGIGLSAVFCVAAGLNSARKIVKIGPAQAMRSETPITGKSIFLDKIKVIWERLSFNWKMSIRNVFRSPTRTLFTMSGIMVTMMFFIISLFLLDCVDYIFKKQFFEFQKYDYKVVFSRPVAYSDALNLKGIKGVKTVDPIMEVPITVVNNWAKKDTLLVGINPKNSSLAFEDENKRIIQLPQRGILISQAIANKLSIKPGDTVKIKIYLDRVIEKNVLVAGLCKEYIGFNCYMNIKQLGSLTEEGRIANGAYLNLLSSSVSKVKKELVKAAGIQTFEDRLATFNSQMQYMDLTYVFEGFMLALGATMGFAIVFNATIINIMERRRELASLEVLGYTHAEIQKTLLRENLLLGILSVLPGMLLGYYVSVLLGKFFSTDLFALEVIIYPRTYLISIAGVFIFILLAQWANRKNIFGLDMVEVLKNREN
jgi:putative ABC transport system permease protein